MFWQACSRPPVSLAAHQPIYAVAVASSLACYLRLLLDKHAADVLDLRLLACVEWTCQIRESAHVVGLVSPTMGKSQAEADMVGGEMPGGDQAGRPMGVSLRGKDLEADGGL